MKSIYNLNINNKYYKLELYNYAIIQLCEIIHIGIPRFCYHEHLSIAGNCRMCLVELKGSLKPIVSCAYQIADNMVLFTNSVLIKNARENILEFLLINHPLDCPICDQGGECDLQDQSYVYGRDKSRFTEIKRAVLNQNWGPFIKTVMTRCIHCTRCIRYFSEIAGINKFGTIGRGMNTEIETYSDLILDSEIAGNVIDLCPVGALTSKPYSFTARPWELISFESIDLLDSFCSFIRIDLRSQNLLRILPVIKKVDYDYWITDKIRFSYDAFKTQRLDTPKIKYHFQMDDFYELRYRETSWEETFQFMLLNYYYCITNFNIKNIFFYTGKFFDIVSLLVLKNLCFAMNISNLNVQSYFEVDFRDQYLVTNHLLNIEFETVFIIYGINTKIESSILNIKLRKLSLSSNTNKFFYLGNHIEFNYSTIHIGLTMIELLNIYYGRHFSCFFIINYNVTHFLNGPDSFMKDNSIYCMALTLSGKLKKEIFYSYNNLFSGDASILEYNAFARLDSLLIDSYWFIPKFIYLFNTDIFKSLKEYNNVFIIYQGHHVDEIACQASVVLPIGTYLHKSGYYLNYQGDLLYTINILNSSDERVQTDIDIFFAFFKYLKKQKLISNLAPEKSQWNVNNIYYTIYTKQNLYLKKKVLKNLELDYMSHAFNVQIFKYRIYKKIFVEDSFFITTQRNFYTMDVFSKNSVNIANYLSYKQLKPINITQQFI